MRLRNLEGRAFLGLVLLTTIAFFWLVRGFLIPVFWAVVFAVLFTPVTQRLTRLLRGRVSLAAGLTTLLVVLVVLIPFALLTAAVAQQAFTLYQRVAVGEIDIYTPVAFVERSIPPLADLLARYGIGVERVRASLESAAVTASQYVAGQALVLGQNALLVAVLFGLMLYFLFFFLRDGERIVRNLMRALPLGDEREARLFAKFAEVARATVKGTLVVAAVQGALGGILFAVVGIQAPVFWAVVMGILELTPIGGHPISYGEKGVYHAENETAVPGGVPGADRGAGSRRANACGAGARV